MGNKMTSIAIIGKTNIGKTYNSVLTAHKHFNGSLFICRHLEDLKYYKGQECIIFDDISFELIEPTQLIKLCDKDLHCSIRILKTIVRIEPTVTKIFTHNNIEAFRPILATIEQQKAIDRRLTICQVNKRKQVSQQLLEALQRSISIERLNVLSQLLEQD